MNANAMAGHTVISFNKYAACGSMSFRWKWLLMTFLAQLLLGGIFTSIQYYHLSEDGQRQITLEHDVLIAELGALPLLQPLDGGSGIQRKVTGFFNHYGPLFMRVHVEGSEVFKLGEMPSQPDPLMTKRIQPEGANWAVEVVFNPDLIYADRNDAVFFLAGVFLLGAISCSFILLALSGTLSARLETLRLKAHELQEGNIKSRVDVVGRDEISYLGAAFNNMADAIEMQMTAMEEAHARSVSEKNQLDMLLSSLSSGVAYLDEHFKILYYNKALDGMLQVSKNPDKSLSLDALLILAGVVREQRILLKDLVTNYYGSHRRPVELNFTDGRVLQLRFALHQDGGEGAHAVLIVDDVSMRKNVENLRNEVERDPLTGVLNRRGFELMLDSTLARLLPGETAGVMFLDLDGFKSVNDTLGHKAGDQILKTSANLLKGATRSVDHVARLGGDEFAIVVARCNLQLLRNISERIIESFACDKLLVRIRQNHGLTVSCSIGAAMHPVGTGTAQALLEISDAQMYLAKKSGKNCYRIAGVVEPNQETVQV